MAADGAPVLPGEGYALKGDGAEASSRSFQPQASFCATSRISSGMKSYAQKFLRSAVGRAGRRTVSGAVILAHEHETVHAGGTDTGAFVSGISVRQDVEGTAIGVILSARGQQSGVVVAEHGSCGRRGRTAGTSQPQGRWVFRRPDSLRRLEGHSARREAPAPPVTVFLIRAVSSSTACPACPSCRAPLRRQGRCLR